jgi:hypothetical protein
MRPTKWFCWCSVFSIILDVLERELKCFWTNKLVVFWVCKLGKFVWLYVCPWLVESRCYFDGVQTVGTYGFAFFWNVKNCYCKMLSRRCNLYKPVGCWLMCRKCIHFDRIVKDVVLFLRFPAIVYITMCDILHLWK